MSSISESIASRQLLGVVAAANADRLNEQAEPALDVTQTSSGWDAYEVWRRFIKDARDRRRPIAQE